MPEMFSQTVDDSLRAYVRIFLRGLDALPSVRAEGGDAAPRTPMRDFSTLAVSE
jgi:hypothetical protein